LRVAGAQEAECTRQYMSIPSTAGAQDAERSSFQTVRFRCMMKKMTKAASAKVNHCSA